MEWWLSEAGASAEWGESGERLTSVVLDDSQKEDHLVGIGPGSNGLLCNSVRYGEGASQ